MVLDPGAWVTMATTVSPKQVQRRNTSEDDTPTEAAPKANTPVIEDEEQRAVDQVPAIVACQLVHLMRSTHQVKPLHCLQKGRESKRISGEGRRGEKG